MVSLVQLCYMQVLVGGSSAMCWSHVVSLVQMCYMQVLVGGSSAIVLWVGTMWWD